MTTGGGLPPTHQDDPLERMPDDADAETLLRQLDGFLQLLNITHEGVLCVNEACEVVAVNQGAEKMFGYPREQLLGMPVMELVCDRYSARKKHRLAALTRIARESHIGFRTDDIICRRRDGERFPTDISLSHALLPDQHLYTLVVRDTTERVQQAERLTYRAEHDHLTDLPNRTLLYERLRAGMARADRYGRRLGVIYLDLDQFKPINDRYGHETGDCLLQAVARRLSDTVRQSDTVSRIGGDEFIICLEQINHRQDAVATTHKILESLRSPFGILGRQISVGASVGIAIYPDHGPDTETLLRHADKAMYRAKTAGDNPAMYRDGEDTLD